MTSTFTKVQETETNTVSIGDSLKIKSLANITVDLPKSFETCPFRPAANPGYILREEHAKQIAAFLKFPMGDALYVYGPTGSGKTSVVTEVAARLGWSVQSMTCFGRMEMADLIGYPVPVARDGKSVFEFQYGVLPKAMKEGHILILNEIDLVDPSELAGLNDVLEGRPLVIAQNGGEIINAHPMFRVIVTGNSNGSGDDSGDYAGIVRQNLAAMDRYRMMYIGYPDKQTELSILASKAPSILPLHEGMVDTANLIRTAFEGDESNPDAPRLSITMSTRTILRWTNITQLAGASVNAMEKGLESALLMRGTTEDKISILQFAKDTFGDQWVSSKSKNTTA